MHHRAANLEGILLLVFLVTFLAVFSVYVSAFDLVVTERRLQQLVGCGAA